MSATSTERRAAEAADVVRRAGVAKPLTLITVDLAKVTVAEALGVSEPTARRYVLAAVDAGLLQAIRPHADWSVAYAIPGNQEWVGMDVYAHRWESFRLHTHQPTGRPPVTSTLFVAHQEQLDELARIYKAEAAARAAKEVQA